MSRTALTLPNGTKVTVEGTPEEVEQIVNRITSTKAESVPSQRNSTAVTTQPRKTDRPSPTERVRLLKEEGYFREKRTLGNVQSELSEKGHIHAMGDLSPVLIRMTRAGELRRMREKGNWVYVNP
jgi:hypothetical protein